MYQLNADELIQEQCQAREDFEKHERTQKKRLADQEAAINELTNTIKEKDSQILDLSNQVTLLRAELERNKSGS